LKLQIYIFIPSFWTERRAREGNEKADHRGGEGKRLKRKEIQEREGG